MARVRARRALGRSISECCCFSILQEGSVWHPWVASMCGTVSQKKLSILVLRRHAHPQHQTIEMAKPRRGKPRQKAHANTSTEWTNLDPIQQFPPGKNRQLDRAHGVVPYANEVSPKRPGREKQHEFAQMSEA